MLEHSELPHAYALNYCLIHFSYYFKKYYFLDRIVYLQ